MDNSYFDGGLLQLIGWKILGAIVTIFTFGICYPWAMCMIYDWETKHTVVNGKRLKFNGTALQLFGNWIKWWFFTLITLGIYGFWLGINLKKWITKHTEFESYCDEFSPEGIPTTDQASRSSSVADTNPNTVMGNSTAGASAHPINGLLSFWLLFIGIPVAIAGLVFLFLGEMVTGGAVFAAGFILLLVSYFNQ